jgi:hypothetical protein
MTAQSCNADDTRDTGIGAGLVTALANWDTNTGTGTLSGSVGSGSTTGTIAGWSGGGNFMAPPFIALIAPAGGGSTYELVRVTGITGTGPYTFTWTSAYAPSSTFAHTSGDQILYGAAMYTFMLTRLDVRDQNCRRNNTGSTYTGNEVNSWANSSNFLPNPTASPIAYGPLTLTTGMATGTVTMGGIAPQCNGVDTGTIFINPGSPFTATLTGGSTVGGPPVASVSYQRIYIWDGTNLAAFSYVASAYATTGATLTLGGSGTAGGLTCTTSGSPCTYMTSNSGAFTAIWYQNTDTYSDNESLKKNWECKTTGTGTFTLNRNWDGPSRTDLYSSTYTTDGFEQQPFMLGGYKVNSMRWAQSSTNSTVRSDYTTMAQQAGAWYLPYGWDHITGNSNGSYYATVSQICNPPTLQFNPALINNVLVSTLHGGDGGGGNPGCGAVGSVAENGIARVNSAEGAGAMVQCYISGACTKAQVDAFMSAIWGKALPYGSNAGCSASVSSYCDGGDATNCEFSGMSTYKWPGFCLGQGGFGIINYAALRVQGQSTFSPVPVFSGRGILSGQGVLYFVDPTIRPWMTW